MPSNIVEKSSHQKSPANDTDWLKLTKNLSEEEKKLYFQMYSNTLSEIPVKQTPFKKFEEAKKLHDQREIGAIINRAENITSRPKKISDYTKKDIPELLDAILTKRI